MKPDGHFLVLLFLLFSRGACIPLGPGCELSSSVLIRIVGVETSNGTGGSDVGVTGVIGDVDPRGGASLMTLSLGDDEVCIGSSTSLPFQMMLNFLTYFKRSLMSRTGIRYIVGV